MHYPKKGEGEWEKKFEQAYRKTYGQAVSSVRQSIESFFNFLEERVKIQVASKVRSSARLILHVIGKVAAAMVRWAF